MILSGGAYNSPQLLMLSGIGPAEELRKTRHPVLVDLPGVGKNLAEHPLVTVQAETKEPIALLRHLRLDRAMRLGGAVVLHRDRPVRNQRQHAPACSRARGRNSNATTCSFSIPRSRATRNCGGRASIGNQKYVIQCSISLQHPEALGELTLRSADPADKPRIKINLFGSQADIDTTIRGIRLAREIFAQEPLKSMIKGELMPGKDVQSDEALKQFIYAIRRDDAASLRHLQDGS